MRLWSLDRKLDAFDVRQVLRREVDQPVCDYLAVDLVAAECGVTLVAAGSREQEDGFGEVRDCELLAREAIDLQGGRRAVSWRLAEAVYGISCRRQRLKYVYVCISGNVPPIFGDDADLTIGGEGEVVNLIVLRCVSYSIEGIRRQERRGARTSSCGSVPRRRLRSLLDMESILKVMNW